MEINKILSSDDYHSKLLKDKIFDLAKNIMEKELKQTLKDDINYSFVFDVAENYSLRLKCILQNNIEYSRQFCTEDLLQKVIFEQSKLN